VAASVAALDLPDAVVELDLLDGDDALGEGHVADVVDGKVLGGKGRIEGRRNSEENQARQ
jgi:hypothetical protein